MELPSIEFSSWYKWKERIEIPNIDKWWIYIIAKFDDVPNENHANPVDKNIIYIWETCWQSLQKRLYQFDNSAFRLKDGHSGWWSYNTIYWDSWDDLYVAVYSVFDLPEHLTSLHIRYVERKIMLDYALRHNKSTKLNKK